MSNDKTMAAAMTMAHFIGLTPTLPEEIGTLMRPVTMRCHVRHRPLCDVGVEWKLSYLRGWGAVMVAKCSNPSCSASFRSLKEGRLFRLERDPAIRSSESNRAEYFWLCHRCSSAMTLRLREDGTLVTVLLPEPVGGPDGVALTVVDQKKGLLLRSVSFPSPEHLGGRARTRLKGGHHAA
jgi:hypothetical protein